MFASIQFCRLIFGFAYCAAICASLVGAEPVRPSAPREGLLVLANGRVIEGVIAVEGEYFKVLLPKGKLQVRVDQVDFLCDSKEEAYVRRRARRITATVTAEAYLEMARWCLQNDLLAYAELELAAARKVDPQHRQLPGLERQLTQARELFQRGAPSTKLLRDDQVKTASAESERSGRAIGEIPPWARTEFIKRIQPMLAHSCATAGCHLAGSTQQLQIDRLALDGVGNPDLIHRNLASTIAMLDLGNPEKSRLLTMGASAHGTQENQSRSLTPHQLEILRAWATQLALNEPPREQNEQAPITQIVVGMSTDQQRKFASGKTEATASPDPFDPAEFNKLPDDSTADGEAETTQPAEAPLPEQGQ